MRKRQGEESQSGPADKFSLLFSNAAVLVVEPFCPPLLHLKTAGVGNRPFLCASAANNWPKKRKERSFLQHGRNCLLNDVDDFHRVSHKDAASSIIN